MTSKLFWGVAILSLLVALGMAATGHLNQAGPLFILFFLSIALAFRSNDALKGFTYTIMIFAAVTTALYYPSYFVEAGGFKFSKLITPLIQIIMFGMGTSMSLEDFVGVVKMPKGVLIGVVSHFAIMPTIGFSYRQHERFPTRNCRWYYFDWLLA